MEGKRWWLWSSSCWWIETMSLNWGHKWAYCLSSKCYMGVEKHDGMTRDLLIRPPELSGKLICNKAGESDEENDEFCLTKYRFHTLKGLLICCKIVRHAADGFTSLRRNAWCIFLSPLKIHHPRPELNPWTLGPTASTQTMGRKWMWVAIRTLEHFILWNSEVRNM
jgi:hypothetical protein